MGPAHPQSPLARMLAGAPEAGTRWRRFCADLARKHRTIVVQIDDPELPWADRELLKQISNRLYGSAPR